MSQLSSMLERFATQGPAATPKVKDDKSYRVQVGNVFLQPAGVSKSSTVGGKKVKVPQDPATWKYHYPYVGFTNAVGETIAGFSCDSVKLLELAEAGAVTKDVMKTFEKYAEKYVAEGRMVIKQ